MDEKIIIKSKRSINYFLIISITIILSGIILSELLDLDSIEYCIYVWSLSFYYVWPSVILFIIGLIFNGAEIVITDRRAYGKSIFGQRINLPLDSISAVSTFWLHGICISTSSGRISFAFIKNKNEIYECINKLLIERQSLSSEANKASQKDVSSADELKKFKDLLDAGIITQEEFDAKKKQLLGL